VVDTGSESRNWRAGGARSVSPDFQSAQRGRGAGYRGGRRGRGRGRLAAINGGPRFGSGAGVYQFADFGTVILCPVCIITEVCYL